MTADHRVNVLPTGKLYSALCADCPWQVRGVARERADEFATAHQRDPSIPADMIPWADDRSRNWRRGQ